jgi:hypothetical protein
MRPLCELTVVRGIIFFFKVKIYEGWEAGIALPEIGIDLSLDDLYRDVA